MLYLVTLNWYYNKGEINCGIIYNTFTVPFEKSKMVSFASSIIKNIVVSSVPSQARFPVN